MNHRRRDDDTQNYDDDRGGRRRPARKKKRRAKKEFDRAPWVLALVGLVLLIGALMGGLWWRARRHAAASSSPSTGATNPSGTETAAGSAELEAAIAEADRLDPGWRWDQLEAKRAHVPLAENGIRVVMEAGRLLPGGGLRSQNVPAFVDRAGEHRLTEQQIAELKVWLRRRAAALRVALTMADKPRGRYELKVAPDFISTLLPHIQTAGIIRSVLEVEALLRAETGNARRLQVFRAMLNIARSIGDEPFVISQVVRYRIANVAIQSLEQTLSRTAPSDETLATAQKLLNEETVFNALLVAWRGERAVQFGFLEAVDTGKVSLEHVQQTFRKRNESNPTLKPQTWPADASPGSAVLRANLAWSLRHMTELVEVAKLPYQDQPAALAKLSQDEKQAPEIVRTVFYSSSFPTGSNSQKLFQRGQALLRSAIVALAAERFRLQKGRWPMEAKEMDASLVGSLPTDPYDGSPLRFRRLDDGLVVYSIGPDGRDDGGDLGDRGNEAPDVGFRLWDTEKRQ